MSKVIAGILLVVVIGVITYVAVTGGFANSQQVSTVIQIPTVFSNEAGDLLTIIETPKPPPTQEQIMEQQRQTTGTNGSLQQNSTISGSVGKTYGFTDQYDLDFGNDIYKIGTPVIIQAKLTKVIPDSCELDQATQQLVNCDYIEPAKFKYLFYVSCDFRDACNLADISRWDYTDNSGFLMERVDTNPSSFNSGWYKATVTANSEVKDANGKPYEIKAEYDFRMIN